MDNATNLIVQEVKQIENEIWKLAVDIWNYNELSLDEVQSSQAAAKFLAERGFTLSHAGIGGIDTAWIASWGSGDPVIGFTAEYDALPNLGNDTVACRCPRKDGNTNGHGCGHNLIGAAAVGAGVALKQYIEKHSLAGTIRIFGCPAEELLTGKNYMAKAGAFDGLDACLHFHPFPNTTVINVKTTAYQSMYVEFKGTSSHSGVAPWLGRSALHAVEIFLHGINVMREQMVPEARVHYIIQQGGSAANIVPDYAKINIVYRGPNAENVSKYADWIHRIADGAAQITETAAIVTDICACYDLLPNQVLADCISKHLQVLGTPEWSEGEQQFARKIQCAEGINELGLATAITPDMKGAAVGGTTDVGDISYIVPTSGVAVSCWPLLFAPHTWAATACNGMSIGKKGMLRAIEVLALTGLDLISDPQLLAKAREEFISRTKNKPYKSLCSADKPILAEGHEHFISSGHDEMLNSILSDIGNNNN